MSTSEEARRLNDDVVALSRKVRLGAVSNEEWAERLKRFIGSQPDVSGDLSIENVRAVTAAAGGSSGTLLFEARIGAGGAQPLVLRFAPTEGLFHIYDLPAQVAVQRALYAAGAPAPRQRWMDADGAFLGVPGYVMDRSPGIGPPMAWKTAGVILDASPSDRRAMMLSVLSALARVHALDWRAAGLGFLERRAPGAAPIAREAAWYDAAARWGGLEQERPALDSIRAWLIAREPTADVVLCHGDANLGNYLFQHAKVSAVLDWEMAFLGAPECDLTFLIDGADVIQAGVPEPEGVLSADEMRSAYEAISGSPLRHWDYYRLFSFYRIWIISGLARLHFPPEFLARYDLMYHVIGDRVRTFASGLGAI